MSKNKAVSSEFPKLVLTFDEERDCSIYDVVQDVKVSYQDEVMRIEQYDGTGETVHTVLIPLGSIQHLLLSVEAAAHAKVDSIIHTTTNSITMHTMNTVINSRD